MSGGARSLAGLLAALLVLEVLGVAAVEGGLVDVPVDAWDHVVSAIAIAGHLAAAIGLWLGRRWAWQLTAGLVALDVVLLPLLELRRGGTELYDVAAVGLTLLLDGGILALLDRPRTRDDCGVGPAPRLPVKPLVVAGVLLGVVPLLSTPSGFAAVAVFVAIVWLRRRRRRDASHAG